MEDKNLNQYQVGSNDVIEPERIQVSRDKKWLIIRLNINGKQFSVIKPVAYFEKIIQRAETGASDNKQDRQG